MTSPLLSGAISCHIPCMSAPEDIQSPWPLPIHSQNRTKPSAAQTFAGAPPSARNFLPSSELATLYLPQPPSKFWPNQSDQFLLESSIIHLFSINIMELHVYLSTSGPLHWLLPVPCPPTLFRSLLKHGLIFTQPRQCQRATPPQLTRPGPPLSCLTSLRSTCPHLM